MSVPANLRVGPFTTQALVKKSYLLYYIFLIWISIFAIQLEFWAYWNFFLNILDYKFIHFITFMPFLIFGMYVTAVFVSLIFAKLFLVIINAIHPPREGTFLRDPSDRDYRYWSLRATIKKWPVWLAHKYSS